LNGFTAEPGKTYPQIFISENELNNINVIEFFKSGYTNVILNSSSLEKEFSPFPFNIILNEKQNDLNQIKVESVPNLIIRKDEKVRYAVVNGFLFDIEIADNKTCNALVIKGIK